MPTDESERDIDREIRINELKHEAEALADGEMMTWESDAAPSELLESFWQDVVDYEKAPLTSDFILLEREGIVLPPPEELSDGEITAKIWELIHRLARRRTYITNTDHLDDRELYTELWDETLREAKPDLPMSESAMYGIDILGSGGDEDTWLYMKYFADDEYRARWMKSFPDYVMPEREKPQYDRDRMLPKCEW